jgi:SAM-dependent methyltransferase
LGVLEKSNDFSLMNLIHFAPESFLTKRLRQTFRSYTTADLSMPRVDHHVDLTRLPFTDASYDVVYASHVLEHIKDDVVAIQEIRRILRPNGLAILPVPVVGDRTVEYAEPNPVEHGHVRAPGLDYYDKYRKVFSDVEVFSSEEFEPIYQVFVYEDRSHWPTPQMPQRLPSYGPRHADFVPVCRV